jgi:hypothetical protein
MAIVLTSFSPRPSLTGLQVAPAFVDRKTPPPHVAK